MFNSYKRDSLKFQHLLGLIAVGETSADIAEWLDVSEAFVDEIEAELATVASDALGLADEAAQLARLKLVRLARSVETGYVRASLPIIKPTEPAVLSLPAMTVTIDSSDIEMAAAEIDLDETASWDTGKDGYAVAAARAGLDFYLFLVVPAEDDPEFVLSNVSTDPGDYTLGTDARLIGGFHCARLVQSAASKDQSGWGGLAVGDILPGSIWDISPNDIPEL